MQQVPQVQHSYPYTPAQAQRRAQVIRRPRRSAGHWLLIGISVALGLTLVMVISLGAALMLYMSSGRILPGVSALGVSLRGMTQEEAQIALGAVSEITVRDGTRAWRIGLAELGLQVDAAQTALAARNVGRGGGSLVRGLLKSEVTPVMQVDPELARRGLETLSGIVSLPAQNATIRLNGGQLESVSAATGRLLDVETTLQRLLAMDVPNGQLNLAMVETSPTVLDATPLLEQARLLLATPLTINAYDPIRNETITWALPSEQWGAWLTTANADGGVTFSLDGAALNAFLTDKNAELGGTRSIRTEEAVHDLQAAVAGGTPSGTLRLYHAPTQHTVAPGETLGSIAWNTGIPYWKIAQANPGLNAEALSVGQTITIPSKDVMLPLPVKPNKRIVVSITQQRMWVYENGQVRWDWPTSTGITSSPTTPGIYQVMSHDGTAYASNWNLHMPTFMSIYEAVPDFFNGIHGFPWRNGNQILWENALGQRVTYGCVLISSANGRLLYEWAEDGVVVEIQP